MAATKNSRQLLASQALAAAASVNATELNLSTAYGAVVGVKLTNGASAPTTAPTVSIYVGEASGTKRLIYQASGDTTANSVNDIVAEIPMAAMYVNITITNGATNGITVEAYAQELTGL